MQDSGREIVLDIETTGFLRNDKYYDTPHGTRKKSRDKIVEIAAIELMDGVPTGNTFYALVKPGRPIPERISAIHGITNDMVDGMYYIDEIAPLLKLWIGDDTTPLVIHNGQSFDIPFLNNELEQAGIEPVSNPLIDTVRIARERYEAPNTLDALCDRFGIDRSQRDAEGHGALLDCELLAKVHWKLQYPERDIPWTRADLTLYQPVPDPLPPGTYETQAAPEDFYETRYPLSFPLTPDMK